MEIPALYNGMLKLNCDAGVVRDGVMGSGTVIRNSAGEMDVTIVHQKEVSWDTDIAEAMVIWFGMKIGFWLRQACGGKWLVESC